MLSYTTTEERRAWDIAHELLNALPTPDEGGSTQDQIRGLAYAAMWIILNEAEDKEEALALLNDAMTSFEEEEEEDDSV